MICPMMNCIENSYPQSGEHVCRRSSCPHLSPHLQRREIAAQIAAILRREVISAGDEIRLKGLKAAYARSLESR